MVRAAGREGVPIRRFPLPLTHEPTFPSHSLQLAGTITRDAVVDALKELSNEDGAFLTLDSRGGSFKFVGAGRRAQGAGAEM